MPENWGLGPSPLHQWEQGPRGAVEDTQVTQQAGTQCHASLGPTGGRHSPGSPGGLSLPSQGSAPHHNTWAKTDFVLGPHSPAGGSTCQHLLRAPGCSEGLCLGLAESGRQVCACVEPEWGCI